MKKIVLTFFFVFSLPLITLAYESGEVRINEYSPQPASGNSWVELLSSTSTEIDLAGWQLTHQVIDEFGSTTVATTTLSSQILPAGGLVSIEIILSTTSDALFIYDPTGQRIDGVTYGEISIPDISSLVTPPGLGQSALSLGGPWMATDNPSRNWFNLDPTKQSIIDTFPAGISANLTGAIDWTAVTNLTFEQANKGRFVWPGPLNLTGNIDRTDLQNLATVLNFEAGTVTATGTLASASHTFTSLVPAPAPITPPAGGGGGGGGGSSGSITTPPATTTIPIGRILGVSAFKFTRILRLGMSGLDVQELQKILIAEKFLKIKTATKYFGPATQKALISWKKKNKIRPYTGVISKPLIKYLNDRVDKTITLN